MKHTLLAMIVTSFFVTASTAAEPNKKKQAALTAKAAGPDFAIQGEYRGEVSTDDGSVQVGTQIIALGDGKFRAVGYQGGLPGDGWNSDKEKIIIEAESKNGEVRFASEEYPLGILKNGVISVRAGDQEIGKLKKVTRKSDTLGKKPPQNAVVLFDGTSPDEFKGGKMTEDGLLMQGVTSKKTFQSFQLHLEFQLSFMPYARGQARSNSGVYMQGRYEVQILDSFGLAGKNNEAGGIYEISDPSVNMCYPPLSWQTYDVDFTAAKYDDNGKKTANARMTVKHNGVTVQNDTEVPRSTRASPVKEGPEAGPIYIQNHGNPLRFRNIWLVPKS